MRFKKALIITRWIAVKLFPELSKIKDAAAFKIVEWSDNIGENLITSFALAASIVVKDLTKSVQCRIRFAAAIDITPRQIFLGNILWNYELF